MQMNSETTTLRANLMVSFFAQCNIFCQYTIYWTGLLTKTNKVNKKVKYNISA